MDGKFFTGPFLHMMNSPISHLTDVLQKVREAAQTFESQLKGNESATRAALIDPVLRALGWDIADPGRVLVEKNETVQKKSFRVDYALLGEQKIKIVVEAKKLGGDLKEHFLQLVTYSFGLNVESIFVSDGLIWHHYQNLASNNQNPTQELNLASDNLASIAAYLVQHMDAALISPETPKIDELSQRIEKLESLLAMLQNPQTVEKSVASTKERAKLTESPKPPIMSSPNQGDNWYCINNDNKIRSSKAIVTTVEAFRELARLSEQILPEMEQVMEARFAARKVKVIKRRWLAKSKEELYTNPKLWDSSVEIVPGWWLGTNYSNGDKKEWLKIAVEIARQHSIQFEFYLV